MRGAGVQSARQAVLQVLRFVEERDRAHNERTPCNAWTFSDEPIILGADVTASELLDLPLSGSGASMLARALGESVRRTTQHIDRLRARSSSRRDFHATACSVLVSDLESSDDWIHAGRALARMGRLSLVLVGDRATIPPHAIDPSVFSVIAECSVLSHAEIEEMLRPAMH